MKQIKIATSRKGPEGSFIVDLEWGKYKLPDGTREHLRPGNVYDVEVDEDNNILSYALVTEWSCGPLWAQMHQWQIGK